jgi:hypothetical protein
MRPHVFAPRGRHHVPRVAGIFIGREHDDKSACSVHKEGNRHLFERLTQPF